MRYRQHSAELTELTYVWYYMKKEVLYEKGIPIGLIDIIAKFHNGGTLFGKIDGLPSKEIDNDKGVFHGSPVSALSYIVVADNIMGEYKNDTVQKMGEIIRIKNLDVEYK